MCFKFQIDYTNINVVTGDMVNIYMRDDVYIHSRPGGVTKTSVFIEYLGLGVAKTSTL